MSKTLINNFRAFTTWMVPSKLKRDSHLFFKNMYIAMRCCVQNHSYHLVNPSPYPFIASWILIFTVFFLVNYINPFLMTCCFPPALNSTYLHVCITLLFVTILSWFAVIVVESGEGHHTSVVQLGLKLGVLLFIASEVMFFFSFFWAYFHFSLNASLSEGVAWPTSLVHTLNPWALPHVNTLLLLASGVCVTLAHRELIILKNLKQRQISFNFNLMLTIVLGSVFLLMQFFEYKYALKFSWSNDIYGSIFFLTTGFHGLHVTLGTLALLFCFIRSQVAGYIRMNYNFNIYFEPGQHVGFEAAAWYWHFVDVVWLFLFIFVYIWGG